MFRAAPVISLFRFRPHPLPVKSYGHLHNVGAALLAEGGFVAAVFDLLESGFECGFSGFAGADFIRAKIFQAKLLKFLSSKNLLLIALERKVAGGWFTLFAVLACFKGIFRIWIVTITIALISEKPFF